MDLVLIEDVPNLGEIGDLVKVKPGYGRNYLLPQKLAIPASMKNKKRLEHQKRIAAHRLAEARQGDEALARKLGELSVSIARKVGENNKLYGSVTASDIALALRAQ